MSAPTLPELIKRIRESGGSLTIELALTEIDRRLTALEAPVDMAKIEEDVSFVLLGRDPERAIREASDEDAARVMPEWGAASDPVEAMREACIDVVEGMRLGRDEEMSELRERVVKELRAISKEPGHV